MGHKGVILPKITPFVFSGPCIGPEMNKINDSSNSCKHESENHLEIKKMVKSKFKVVHRSCIFAKVSLKIIMRPRKGDILKISTVH